MVWSIAWVLLEKGALRRLPVLLTALAAFFMLGRRIVFHDVHESVVETAGTPLYVTENPDPGSLVDVRCYPFVNEVFRGLVADHGSYEHSIYGYEECHKYP